MNVPFDLSAGFGWFLATSAIFILMCLIESART